MYTKDDLTPLRLLGIDPGTDTTGLCIGEYTHGSDILTIVDAYTVRSELLVRRHYTEYAEKYGEREAKIAAVVEAILKYIEVWKPVSVFYESPYLGKHAQAFGSGVEIMTRVRQALVQTHPNLPFSVKDPASIKTGLKVSGKSGDKTLMRTALKRTANIKMDVDIDSLDEHSIDSIAVQYYHYAMGVCMNELIKPINRVKRRRKTA